MVFNRNQGNIKAAKFSIQQQETEVNYHIEAIRNEVTTAISRVKYFQSINNPEQLEFSNNYDKLFQNMLESYKNRQVSLLEFTDFLDSYKDNKLKLVEQHIGLVKAIDQLNYTVNSNIIPIQ